MFHHYDCGPVKITLNTQLLAIQAKVAEICELYDVQWDQPHLAVTLNIVEQRQNPQSSSGNYLTCTRMQVDAHDDGLQATFESGAFCTFSPGENRWDFFVPPGPPTGLLLVSIEDLMTLVLTTSWRQLGWVPLHAGAVTKGNTCAILCAPSGGGKSTLTVAMLNRQWRSLGDDKLLLRLGQAQGAEVKALLHNFNLHPKTRHWFPNVGDLSQLPPYSIWTPKRRVNLTTIWPQGAQFTARPTHLVQIVRTEDTARIKLSPLDSNAVLSLLLHQTVIPQQRKIAQQILSTIAGTAARLQGWRLEIGENAYCDPHCLAPVERTLMNGRNS
jgi:hypothetical protein